MDHTIANNLREAEANLELKFPKKLFDLIRKLEKPIVHFGQEEWVFPSVTENSTNSEENFIISNSIKFNKEWNLQGLVFAKDHKGNYLLLLQGDHNKLLKEIFILLTESKEIKIFNNSLEKLLTLGPLDYLGWEDYYMKLEDGEVYSGGENS